METVQSNLVTEVRQRVAEVVVGQDTVVERLLIALFTGGHLLLQGVPGLAKTLLVQTISNAIDLRFSRVQFTIDLLPSDILGSEVLDQRNNEFRTRLGPIFTNLLLADEINRAAPKVQSALLEAMQERQVTIEGKTYELPRPFVVIATQNPIEQEGTYPLPEAQLDRFLVRLRVGYPTKDEEKEILRRRMERKRDEVEIRPVVTREEVIEMQRAVEDVYISEPIIDYIVDIVEVTRRDRKSVEIGASPRGSLALMKLSRAYAAIEGRDYVIPDDVKAIAVPALSHRLILKRELWYTRVSQESVMEKLLEKVPVPKFE